MIRNSLNHFSQLIILLLCANIANYSFFTYTYAGTKLPAAINTIFIILRLLVSLLPAFIILTGRFKTAGFKSNFRLNWDVFLLTTVGLASSFFVNNFLEVLTYVIWMFCSTVVVVFWLSKQVEYTIENRVLELAKVLTYSHGIVLLLLMLNITQSMSANFQMPFSSKNFYAYSLYILFFAIGLLLYAKDFVKDKSNNKPILLTARSATLISALVLCIYFIMISGRRSPLVAMGLVLIALSWLKVRRSRLYLLALMGGLILVLSKPTIFKEFRSLDRLEMIQVSGGEISEQGYSNSMGERYEIWRTYREVFETYPIFGVGPGNAAHVHEKMFPHSGISGYSPHNSYLAVLVEYGIVGMVLLVIVLLRNALLILRMKRGLRILYTAFTLGLAFICLFEYNSAPGQILFVPILISLLWPRFILVRGG